MGHRRCRQMFGKETFPVLVLLVEGIYHQSRVVELLRLSFRLDGVPLLEVELQLSFVSK